MPAINTYQDQNVTLDSPYVSCEAVTPSDEDELAVVSRAIFTGDGGTMSVIMLDGTQADFVNLAAGLTIPIRVRQVKATGTDATNILSFS